MPKKATAVNLVKVDDRIDVTKREITAREYIEREYPNLSRFDNIPELLRAILTEVVNGRMKHE